MLILKRAVGERVFIGSDIWVKVLEVDGNEVRLGFEAPKNLVVDREEVVLRKIRENQAAVK